MLAVHFRPSAVFLVFAVFLCSPQAFGQKSSEKPNILIIWGDDIGYWNPSFVNNGMMGYKTPNIDRIAKEGIWFTGFLW